MRRSRPASRRSTIVMRWRRPTDSARSTRRFPVGSCSASGSATSGSSRTSAGALHQAPCRDARLPRRDGRRAVHRAPTERARPAGARRARAEDARAGCGASRRRAPVPRPGPSTPHQARRSSDPPRSSRPTRRSCSTTDAGRGTPRSPVPTSTATCRSRTTEQLPAPGLRRGRPRQTEAATGSSTPSSHGVTSTTVGAASSTISTRAPTHVAVQVLTADLAELPLAEYRVLAHALRDA